FIHCRRDLRDVAVSCWMTNFRHLRWAADPDHIAARFRDYQRLVDHWRGVLPVEVLGGGYEGAVGGPEGVGRPVGGWGGAGGGHGPAGLFKSRRRGPAPPAPPRCASRSTRAPWRAGRTTRRPSARSSANWRPCPVRDRVGDNWPPRRKNGQPPCRRGWFS